MEEIDLELRRARLMDHRVDVEPGLFAILVNMLDDVFELVERFEAIRLARRFGPARSSDWGREREIWIQVPRHEVEFDFGRDYWLPALLGIELEHAL